MPASLHPSACSLSLTSLDMMEPTATSNDNRTEQLALQLALLQQGGTAAAAAGLVNDVVVDQQHHHHHHHHHHQPPPPPSSLLLNGSGGSLEDLKTRRSQNMTECVPVPSSEHVAEIVGRQGCKIKALRAKTNTYIKTPVRGEEPVFVVTGRKEDVAAAKREILSAADHFSQIRASRKNNINSTLALGQLMANTPGQTTVQVRVPYRVVGLVVGPKGATIKRIQQQTRTYIVTPSRDKEPVFEVTGLPENVEAARKEIEAHIALRTGQIAAHDAISATAPQPAGPGGALVGHAGHLYADLNGDDLGFHSNLSSSLSGNLDLISSNEGKFSSILNGLDSPYSSLTGGNNGQATTGITLRSLLESNPFDLGIRCNNGVSGSNNGSNGHLIPWSNGDSHDSGIGNSPPFAGLSSAADAGHSLNSIWGDLNRALGGLDLNGSDNEPRAFVNVGSRSSLDLGTLGRPLIGGNGSNWVGSQSPPHNHNSLMMNNTANNNKNYNGYVDSSMSLPSSRSSTTNDVATPPSSILTLTKEATTSSNHDQNMVDSNKANYDNSFEPDHNTFIPENVAFPSNEAPLSCAGDFF